MIVDSSIVSQVDENKLNEFVSGYKTFKVKPKAVKTTVSKDWARFSRCYVLEIESSDILEFLGNFNTTFDAKARVILPHLTFAIKPRDIALNNP